MTAQKRQERAHALEAQKLELFGPPSVIGKHGHVGTKIVHTRKHALDSLGVPAAGGSCVISRC